MAYMWNATGKGLQELCLFEAGRKINFFFLLEDKIWPANSTRRLIRLHMTLNEEDEEA